MTVRSNTVTAAIDAIEAAFKAGLQDELDPDNTSLGWTLTAPIDASYLRREVGQNEGATAELPLVVIEDSGAIVDNELASGGSHREVEILISLALATDDVAADATPREMVQAHSLYAERMLLTLRNDLMLGRSASLLAAAGVWDVRLLQASPTYDEVSSATSSVFRWASFRYAIKQLTIASGS